MIHQGHRYSIDGHSVIAMESASRGIVGVCRIEPSRPGGLERLIYVACDKLKPEPLKYLGGALPGEKA